jgi:hypothetical protein
MKMRYTWNLALPSSICCVQEKRRRRIWAPLHDLGYDLGGQVGGRRRRLAWAAAAMRKLRVMLLEGENGVGCVKIRRQFWLHGSDDAGHWLQKRLRRWASNAASFSQRRWREMKIGRIAVAILLWCLQSGARGAGGGDVHAEGNGSAMGRSAFWGGLIRRSCSAAGRFAA